MGLKKAIYFEQTGSIEENFVVAQRLPGVISLRYALYNPFIIRTLGT